MMAKKSCNSVAPWNGRMLPRRQSSIACPIRKPDTDYVVRFTAPEFTSLCPVTGQPDFAHLVIDYVPGQWLLESKSLKLYVASFRNHGAFHEDCTVMIGKRIAAEVKPKWLAHRRLLVSARRHPDRRVLADRPAAEGHVDSRPGRRALSRAGLIGTGRPVRRTYRVCGPTRPTITIDTIKVATIWQPVPLQSRQFAACSID